MIEQIENAKQQEVLEEDRRFQESIKLREKELMKRKVVLLRVVFGFCDIYFCDRQEELGNEILLIQAKLKSKGKNGLL